MKGGLMLNDSHYNQQYMFKFGYDLNDMEGWKTLDFTSTHSQGDVQTR